MWRLADRTIDEFADTRHVRVRHASTRDRSRMLVVADLLGVPEEDHETFRAALGPRPGRTLGSTGDDEMSHNPLEFLYQRFTDVHRRSAPRTARRRDDRASPPRRSPTARRPRSSTSCASPRTCSRPARRRPCASSPPRSCSWASGPTCSSCCATTATASRTSSRKRCASRARSRVTSGWRASPSTVGGVEIPAGTTLMVLNGAANRDPAPLREPRRVRRRPRERAPAHRVRPRHPHVPGCAARARRGTRQHRAAPRPPGRHHDLRVRARAGRRPALPVRADVHPARPEPAPPRVLHLRDAGSEAVSARGSGRRWRAGPACRTTRVSAAIAKSIVASTARSTCRFSTRFVASTACCGSAAILCAGRERGGEHLAVGAHVVGEADLGRALRP